MMSQFQKDIEAILSCEYGTDPQHASVKELYQAVSHAAMNQIRSVWKIPRAGKTACYFSAEFLIGRMVYSNLLNMELLQDLEDYFKKNGLRASLFEEIEDAALGNGGLGRLAACFLDSAATLDIPLNGYGIRYRYGLFRQYFEDGFQKETGDNWERFGDPWSVRREEERVVVRFRDQTVYAVPYDMPVIGYGGRTVNTLRLWQAEPLREFDFQLFNEQKYDEAFRERNAAEAITDVLYPNDDTAEGKRLRLKQQYFFSSASLQSILRDYKRRHGDDFSAFSKEYAIQLNDTHPTVSIPELLRILMSQEYLPFDKAFQIVRETFAYTNHTIMPEALEKWDVDLFLSVIPEVYPYIICIENALMIEIVEKGVHPNEWGNLRIIQDNQIHMARLAVFATHSTNGVAKIHSELIKQSVLKDWYALYPERFQNKTNGITQRRWLALCNRELSSFITEKIGDKWLTDLTQLKRLEPLAEDPQVLERFEQIKLAKKRQLAEYIGAHEGIELDPAFLFDIQVKRLHEYKRQLLNAFSILDIYYGIKDGRIREFAPSAYLFGAKAAPGYFRAKGIIKYLNEIAAMINTDPDMKGKLQMVFVQNYNVSYAEKLIPAADISEQISTAGTEASGTSNMKFMLNGAITLGTYDGANIEIVEQAGEENNYIFGARVEDLERIKASYNPREIYEREPRIKRVLDTLVDGTFQDGGTGMFRELYTAILDGASWHKPDHYYLLEDFLPYVETKLKANEDYRSRQAFTIKMFLNMCNAGIFSSDRTIAQYAHEIWNII